MERMRRAGVGALLLASLLVGGVTWAQATPGQAPEDNGDELVQLDFDDVELAVVIDTIARLTNRNFIYDDRVRGRVTIVSPTRIPVDQAYAVFESVLQVKGFTTIEGPGGAIKIIPVREAKESPVETVRGLRPPPRTDRFVTRLIPLRYIDADAITNTLKPLVSQNASMVAYPPTNTVILTDAATNIRRLLSILGAIDVESYKEDLAVLRLKHADAGTLAQQLTEVFGGEVGAAGASPVRPTRRRVARAAQPSPEPASAGTVRILTDERTNSLIVLASRGKLDDIRAFVRKIDVPVEGGGRINVYYLKHADAEELAQTLNALLSGQTAGPAVGGAAAGAQPQVLRAAVTEFAGGLTVTSDPFTNSIVIQGSPEGYAALVSVIEQLDIPRPQVLVEALIMEVDVSDGEDLGFNGLVRLVRGETDITLSSVTDTSPITSLLGLEGDDDFEVSGGFLGRLVRQSFAVDPVTGEIISNGSLVQGLIRASATDDSTNILSSPHILTSDNEEAEILVGNNIPIVTSRVQSATGATVAGLSTSVNVERQDIGITLRVTPQITEGDSLRLKIFQELTAVNESLTNTVAGGIESAAADIGVALLNRRIENTVVVADGETVVIGGLISEQFEDNETKVPWLGDIPILGWAFKTVSRSLVKQNLLVFLTPHIIRRPADLEYESVRKREEFRQRSEQALGRTDVERERERLERTLGPDAYLGMLGEPTAELNAARAVVSTHEKRYPLERMREIEQMRQEERDAARAAAEAALRAPRYGVLAAVFRDARVARETLTELLDAGYEGTLVSGDSGGVMLFEIRIGPYDTLEETERAARMLREVHDLEPRVLIAPQEQP